MSREIKFRAWDKEKRIWVSNGEIEFSISEGTLVVCPNTVEHIGDSVHDTYVAKRFEVVRFTGLKDKNGVEIYEGDILNFANILPFVVTFHNGGFVYSYPQWSNYCPITKDILDASVVGNIYENPELLTQEETTHGN
jgi:uncharacterized phage protein (TIGR01671 family)